MWIYPFSRQSGMCSTLCKPEPIDSVSSTISIMSPLPRTAASLDSIPWVTNKGRIRLRRNVLHPKPDQYQRWLPSRRICLHDPEDVFFSIPALCARLYPWNRHFGVITLPPALDHQRGSRRITRSITIRPLVGCANAFSHVCIFWIGPRVFFCPHSQPASVNCLIL